MVEIIYFLLCNYLKVLDAECLESTVHISSWLTKLAEEPGTKNKRVGDDLETR